MDAPQRPTNQGPHGNATAQASQDKPSRADACDDGMGGPTRSTGERALISGGNPLRTDRRLNPTATDRRTSSIASRSPTAIPRARAASSGSGSATSP